METVKSIINAMEWGKFVQLTHTYFRNECYRPKGANDISQSSRAVVIDIISERHVDVFYQYWNTENITVGELSKFVDKDNASALKGLLGIYHSIIVTRSFVDKKAVKYASKHGFKIVSGNVLAKHMKNLEVNSSTFEYARFCKALS